MKKDLALHIQETGMTLKEFADKVGISLERIRLLVDGRRRMDEKEVISFAHILGIEEALLKAETHHENEYLCAFISQAKENGMFLDFANAGNLAPAIMLAMNDLYRDILSESYKLGCHHGDEENNKRLQQLILNRHIRSNSVRTDGNVRVPLSFFSDEIMTVCWVEFIPKKHTHDGINTVIIEDVSGLPFLTCPDVFVSKIMNVFLTGMKWVNSTIKTGQITDQQNEFTRLKDVRFLVRSQAKPFLRGNSEDDFLELVRTEEGEFFFKSIQFRVIEASLQFGELFQYGECSICETGDELERDTGFVCQDCSSKFEK
ncbi:helix-turn-helix transcriptional regulator [Brevibacillus sp. AG]|uniref:helix-turn-helix domain-containing protein n=1 Tax=Brevibacillus sp. AG TaxID=3020891 RepID=UPI00232D8BDA|nr:helix-turn-helix transcriptional regulator [Brevibacillus sp. AG]MDC0764871.1 helix-turn-helix transcriptional regulator [Brevibacillus sp. AG]